MPSNSQNYELWDTNTFLGVFRDIKPDPLYWADMFAYELRSNTEWIDFEKLPIQGRKLAPFVMPLARGASVYDDSGKGFRFKPAYTKVEDQIDPLMPLIRRVGIDQNMTQMPVQLSPAQRLVLIRAAMAESHVRAIHRRWNWMAATSLRDGKCTISGPNYPTTLIDFQRAAGHTITLTGGNRFGDSGVSIVDFVQGVVDTMGQADFGGVPVRATMGGGVWGVMRKDPEFLKHMDVMTRGGNITYERGLVASKELVYKVGEMLLGGGSGQSIELWVDNSTYIDPDTGAATRYIGNSQILFTAVPEAIGGTRAYGRIIDRAANWEALPIFPKNWVTMDDVQVEFITHKSAPLYVPVNPNATLLGNVIA
ncbi:major capsid protein [Mesorhizobium sp. AR07]|uniref:major capsid protein n=1 Tax=Mesorhizobium sp. AR07 TaxID=2865838 RepID=UPI00215FC133|nr:major capsid protein [Mesorhizobium sp. AR07]UVK46824.1 major capsid protein [Mesorhizobium sp. AR07]